MHPDELMLASASPRRSELLKRIGLQFKTCPANVHELNRSAEGPEYLVAVNARLKADALIEQFPDALILGSDTTVALGEVVLNKPSDLEAARAMLKQLSGRAHTVYTAVALLWKRGDFCDEFVEASRVQFKHLDNATIDAYFEIVNPLDKAGSYGIQAGRELIVESVEGSVENVMGLPIQTLQTRLLQLGFDFRESR
jgi:septum formation protein